MAENIISVIDDNLNRYYSYLNKPYKSSFSDWCHTNGFDEENVYDELANIKDCILDDFDLNFPFKNTQMTMMQRETFIKNLLIKCMKMPNAHLKMLSFNATLFQVDLDVIDDIASVFAAQYPSEYRPETRLMSICILYILAIGRHHGFGFPSAIYVLCSLDKVASIRGVPVATHTMTWLHLFHNKLLQIQSKRYCGIKTAADVVLETVSIYLSPNAFSFSSFCTGHAICIDDSLETTCRYFGATMETIMYLLRTSEENVIPFQMDLSIVYGETETVGNIDVEAFGVNEGNMDIMGNMQRQLEENGLKVGKVGYYTFYEMILFVEKWIPGYNKYSIDHVTHIIYLYVGKHQYFGEITATLFGESTKTPSQRFVCFMNKRYKNFKSSMNFRQSMLQSIFCNCVGVSGLLPMEAWGQVINPNVTDNVMDKQYVAC